MKEKARVHSLYEEFLLVQFEDYMSKNDETIKEMERTSRRRLLISFIPYFTSCVGAICARNPYILIAGTAYLGASAIVFNIKDEKERKRKYQEAAVNNQGPYRYSMFPSVEYDGTIPIITKSHEDYYREEYKAYLKSLNTKDVPASSTEEVTPIILSKEETMRQVVNEYDVLNSAYKLPPMAVSNEDWDLLYDLVYQHLEKINALDRFYEYMRVLTRYALASSLVHSDYEISLQTYLNALPIMEKIGFPNIDIKSIKKVVRKTKSYGKVISYDFAAKRRLG